MRFIAEDTAEKCYTFLVDYIIERINNYKSPDGSMMGIVLPTYNTVTAPLYETIFLFYCGPGDYLLFFYSFKELVAAFQAGKVSFRYVRLYQLEEYLGVNKFDECSKAFQLFSEFLKFVDMPHENVNFIQADSPNIIEEVKRYEKCIVDNGGIDLAIVEVNSDGGIGGNDPGSGLTTRTRVKTLSDFVFNDRCHTRQGLIDIDPKLYINLDKPGYTCVVTMGLQTLLECKEVVQLFIGFNKARALHRCVEGSIHNMFPASIFQLHQRPCIVADKSALGELRLNTIQYYLGLRETYNTVHKMNRNINTEGMFPLPFFTPRIISLSNCQSLYFYTFNTSIEHSGGLPLLSCSSYHAVEYEGQKVLFEFHYLKPSDDSSYGRNSEWSCLPKSLL